MQDQIEHARLTMIVQAAVDAKTAVESYKEYLNTAFPYLEVGHKRESDSIKSIIERELRTFGKDGIQMTPANKPNIQSRMKRTHDSNADKRTNKLMRRIGTVV